MLHFESKSTGSFRLNVFICFSAVKEFSYLPSGKHGRNNTLSRIKLNIKENVHVRLILLNFSFCLSLRRNAYNICVIK